MKVEDYKAIKQVSKDLTHKILKFALFNKEELTYAAKLLGFWSTREIQSLLGYSKWKNFEKVIQKAKMPVRMQVKMFPIIFLTSGKRYPYQKEQRKKLLT